MARVARALLAGVAVAGALACARGSDVGAPRHLLLVSFDTLRADRLGAYGYPRETSPALDALARGGVRFETVVAESSWTLPSHVTLFTGLEPSQHGVVQPMQRPAAEIPLLAEVLRGAGFRTHGFTGGSFLARRFGFDRGFETWADDALSFPHALALARSAIEAAAPDERWFVFVHTYAVHCPYDPPAAYARRFDTRPPADHLEVAGRCGEPHYNAMDLRPGQVRFLSDRYDAGIRHADDLLGGTLDALAAAGRLADALVVVVSDHGEEFHEHGRIGHRDTLHLESLRVPWILAGPGLRPAVIAEPAGLADVMPTLLDLLGVSPPPGIARSLGPLLRGERPPDPDRPRFSQNDWGLRLRSLVQGEHHLIANVRTREVTVFDWRSDPLEQDDLAGARPDLHDALWRRLSSHFQRATFAGPAAPPGTARIPDVSQRERLRALGYVE